MINLADKQHCTGCMACVQVCAVGAVTISKNEFGDVFPLIDAQHCVKCKKCIKACSVLCPSERYTSKRAYATWSLNAQTRKKSASGGAASEMYMYALENGFWVCGTEYDETCCVVHSVSKDITSVEKYRQSKYVYSDFSSSYQQIERLLKNGEKVLCISLPCKIAGLLAYLGKEYENLYTVDIICHGTPSADLLKSHILSLAQTTDDIQVCFREDNQFLFSLKKGEREIYRKYGRTDTYLAAFLEGLSYRESCYHCTYAAPTRVADLTIGDFWGLGAELPFDHPYTGSISAVLVNTPKGEAFFELCRDRFFVEERPVSEAIKGNAQLNVPTPRHRLRDEYEALYRQVGFEKAVCTCLKDIMIEEKKKIQKQELRKKVRALAGFFVKRYRS